MKPTVAMLNTEELRYIDALSKDILGRVGFVCDDEEAISLFADGGAKIDSAGNTVFISERMIDSAKETFSPFVKLYGRGDREPLNVGGDNIYFGTTGFAPNYLDGESGEYRPSTYEDLVNMIRLCDMLDPPDYILPSVGPMDVDLDLVDLYEFKAALLNSTKHIEAEAANREHALKIIRMAEEIAGDESVISKRPFFSFLVTLTSPLHHRTDSTQLIIEAASRGIPLFIESGPMAGATSPITLAETVAVANAELLSSIVLAKLVNPDVPVIYASWARVFNMKYANVSVGCPEFGMLRVATSQMGKYYGLPVGGGGTLTDSLSVDAQLGVEQCSTTLLPALAGTNMIQGMGLLAGMNATSMETLAFASETANYIKRVCRGIETNGDVEPAAELIEKVGPRGNFLTAEHTCRNFKSELWLPTAFDCSQVKEGKAYLEKNALTNIRSKIEKCMANYSVSDSAIKTERALESIIRS